MRVKQKIVPDRPSIKSQGNYESEDTIYLRIETKIDIMVSFIYDPAAVLTDKIRWPKSHVKYNPPSNSKD